MKNRVAIGTHHVGLRRIIVAHVQNAREMRLAFKLS